MTKNIPEKVVKIYRKLEDAGYEVYLVGGCVRNLLLDHEVSDWDMTTNAHPDQIQIVFPDSFYDNSFGTVGVKYEENNSDTEKEYAEITTFRTEHGYTDFRHPGKVEWGTTLQEDVMRRDFTVNALALKILANGDIEVVDLVDGKSDLEKKIIRAVGNPDERFKEDALRLLRAIRFTTQLNFTIDEKTLNAIKNDASLITHVSFERIRDELFRILSLDRAYEGIVLLDEVGLLEIILPELTKGKGISQVRPGRHHTSDVFTHNLLSLKFCPSKDPLVKFAALIHDIGKPYIASTDNEGYVIFYNHEVEGAHLSQSIAERFRLSKKQKEKLFTLIRWHMFTVDEHITDSAVRRFIRRVGLENVTDMIDLRIGDRLGSGTKTAESWRLKQFKEKIEKELNPPFSINDLAINGNDVMEALGIPPGRRVGEILQLLFEDVDEDLSRNNKDYLLQKLKEIS